MASRKFISSRSFPDLEKRDDLENLFVFGYHCKVFRDDERARYIDQGRHLIPWMGDNSILIDRSVMNTTTSRKISVKGVDFKLSIS